MVSGRPGVGALGSAAYSRLIMVSGRPGVGALGSAAYSRGTSMKTLYLLLSYMYLAPPEVLFHHILKVNG